MKKKSKVQDPFEAPKKYPDDQFDQVWQVMKETYETERHFNNLETQYRILASQWLLGAFAGIGFVFVSDPILSFDKLWLVVGICIISSAGIFQLWRMDIIIYQRLLHAAFAVGLELEEEFSFLPKIKTRMKDSVPEKNVTHVLFYYYYMSIVFFTLVAIIVCIYLLNQKLAGWILAAGAVVVIGGLIYLHRHMLVNSKENTQNL